MQAMQYRVLLPDDYDMAVIRRRVEDKGALTDAFPGLAVKAYCVSDRARTGQANAYAPFYLWHATAGMADFLFGDPFAGLVSAFGRPRVDHWLVSSFTHGAAFDQEPRSATRSTSTISADADLSELRRAERARGEALSRWESVHCHAVAIDPATWQLTRFTLWTDAVEAHTDQAVERYEVLHLSSPGSAAKRLTGPGRQAR